MKKAFLILVAVFCLGFAANAQNNLGFRLGTDTEISWQKYLSDVNRLELDFGFRDLFGFKTSDYTFISISGIYQWHWNIVNQLGWYVGPGATMGFYVPKTHENNGKFGIALGGQIGLDYEFAIPLQLSLDFRPMWNFIGAHVGFGMGACLGVRYMF